MLKTFGKIGTSGFFANRDDTLIAQKMLHGANGLSFTNLFSQEIGKSKRCPVTPESVVFRVALDHWKGFACHDAISKKITKWT